MRPRIRKKISKYSINILEKVSIILKYFFLISTLYTMVIYAYSLGNPNINPLIDFVYTYEDNIKWTIGLLMGLLILSYILEVIFASDIGEITWKNTASLMVLIILLMLFWYGKRKYNTKVLLPFFIPIFLVAFWYYFTKEINLLKRSRVKDKKKAKNSI